MKDIPVVENIMQQANLKEADYGQAFWMNPNGSFIEVTDVGHGNWAEENAKDNGIRLPPGDLSNLNEIETGNLFQSIMSQMFEHGWVRIKYVPDHELSFELFGIHDIPDYLNNFILQHPVKNIYISDEAGDHVKLSYEDIIEQGLLKAVNKALQQKRMSTASKHEDSAEGRICIDFDQTIAIDKENGTIEKPEPNAKAAIDKLKADGWYIIIFSHRSTTEYGEDQIKEFLDKYDIPYDEIYTEKPNAEFFIDDRAITFTTWDEVLKKVETEHLPEKTAALDNAYWIDPSGKVYQVRGSNFGTTYSGKDTHDGWIRNNLLMLKHDYGIEPRKDQWGSHLDSRDLIEKGWIRIGDSYRGDWGLSVKNLNSIPSFVDNLLAQFVPSGSYIQIDDSNNNYQRIEWPVKSLQQAVNQAQRQPVTAALDLPIINPKTLNRKEPYALLLVLKC